jgi:hypothetical protein
MAGPIAVDPHLVDQTVVVDPSLGKQPGDREGLFRAALGVLVAFLVRPGERQ